MRKFSGLNIHTYHSKLNKARLEDHWSPWNYASVRGSKWAAVTWSLLFTYSYKDYITGGQDEVGRWINSVTFIIITEGGGWVKGDWSPGVYPFWLCLLICGDFEGKAAWKWLWRWCKALRICVKLSLHEAAHRRRPSLGWVSSHTQTYSWLGILSYPFALMSKT